MTISLSKRLQDRLGGKAGLAQGSQECGFVMVRDNPDGPGLQVGLDASGPVKAMQDAGQGGDAALTLPITHVGRGVESG